MECTVSWTGGLNTRSGMGFVAETGSGHTLVMDGAPDADKPENGGQNLAPRPMETLLAGTGGCTAYDVVLILKRGRHAVQGCTVKLSAERANHRAQGVHEDSHALYGDRQGGATCGCRARRGHEPRKILLGHHHVGQNRRHYHQF
jgi:uncharacterized OsmC-like protein